MVQAELVDDPPMSFVEHLGELRQRLIWCVGFLIAGAALVYSWSEEFMKRLAKPVGELVFVQPMEAFDTRFKVAFYGGFLLALPLILHQIWLFVARAVGPNARRMVLRLLPLSYALFLAGAAMCFFVVVPPATAFFLSFGTANIKPFISLGAYLDLVVRMTLSFGAAFQLPLVMFGLNRIGLISRSQLAAVRRPFYFVSFIVGAVFTSPEVFTQLCLAFPLIILFEVAVLVMRDRPTP